ncbi:uncharacterized membrane protein YkvA (DUF1232 family) [Sinorhizobium fredii]
MFLERAKQWARDLKRDIVALWIAARDPRTPWYAKAAAGAIAAYALSPIDLIPDFIPILGYLDELLILPIGIALAVRLIPSDHMAEFRREAAIKKNQAAQFTSSPLHRFDLDACAFRAGLPRLPVCSLTSLTPTFLYIWLRVPS